ncbi:MAG: ABC transporter permease [Ignavibacteria bacterium]|nr:ABC transporter permease [Ignavibacteria bacterium]
MNYKFFIAKRYLFSKKDTRFVSFITYMSVLGVALGVAALIISVSILNGFEKEISDKISRLVSHIQISSFETGGIKNYDSIANKIRSNVKIINNIVPYIQREAVIRAKGKVEGIIIKGITNDLQSTFERMKILQGSGDLNPYDTIFSSLIIGDKLANKLSLNVDDKAIIFGLKGLPSPENLPKIKQFRIKGIYETGLREYDDLIIYTDLNTLQKFFNMESTVTAIEISLTDVTKVNEVAEYLKKILRYPFYIRTMYQIHKELFTWVELQKAPTPFILGLIIIVATFNIVGTLLMLVIEKTHSIGVLKALGCSNTEIMKIFIYDGFIIGFLGIVLGNIIGIGLLLLEMNLKFFRLPEQYYVKSVPIIIQADYVILISLITAALIFLATLIPSFIASRFDPVKSIRFA